MRKFIAPRTPSKQVYARENSSIFVHNGRVFAYGDNTHGQLGSKGELLFQNPIVQVVMEEMHSLFLDSLGNVYYVGNLYGSREPLHLVTTHVSYIFATDTYNSYYPRIASIKCLPMYGFIRTILNIDRYIQASYRQEKLLCLNERGELYSSLHNRVINDRQVLSFLHTGNCITLLYQGRISEQLTFPDLSLISRKEKVTMITANGDRDWILQTDSLNVFKDYSRGDSHILHVNSSNEFVAVGSNHKGQLGKREEYDLLSSSRWCAIL